MTEDMIERRVERAFDRLDASLMAGNLMQAEYDQRAKQIHEWAEKQYARRLSLEPSYSHLDDTWED